MGPKPTIRAGATILAENELLTAEQECGVVANVAVWRHGYVSLRGSTLAGIAENAPSPSYAHFKAAAECDGEADADIPSHILAAIGAMKRLWQSHLPSFEQGRCAGYLLVRLIADRDNWREVLDAVGQQLNRVHRLTRMGERSVDYFYSWRTGHFL